MRVQGFKFREEEVLGCNVEVPLIKGVTIALSCRAGKIPYKQICFLTRFEPNKVYLGPNRNNKGVTIILFCSPKIPNFRVLKPKSPLEALRY